MSLEAAWVLACRGGKMICVKNDMLFLFRFSASCDNLSHSQSALNQVNSLENLN